MMNMSTFSIHNTSKLPLIPCNRLCTWCNDVVDGASGVMKVGGKGSSTPLTGMLCKVELKIMLQ